jgi:hypothetical protein
MGIAYTGSEQEEIVKNRELGFKRLTWGRGEGFRRRTKAAARRVEAEGEAQRGSYRTREGNFSRPMRVGCGVVTVRSVFTGRIFHEEAANCFHR